jgi:hypothetical protein
MTLCRKGNFLYFAKKNDDGTDDKDITHSEYIFSISSITSMEYEGDKFLIHTSDHFHNTLTVDNRDVAADLIKRLTMTDEEFALSETKLTNIPLCNDALVEK